MRCNTCGSDNKQGRKFCSSCGGALPLACASCGYGNEPDDRFCGGCGAALVKTEAADSEGELRPVTILFADLSGYTALSNTLDPDETRELLNAFFAAADGAVAAAGGRVDKHIGDCVMAMFGAPVAHGDDIERAARAAIDIRNKTRALAKSRDLELDSHSGIATGLVAAGDTGSSVHKTYTVIGQAVNLAARLCELAASGEILVTADISRAISGEFSCEDERSVRIDGFANVVGIANLREARSASRVRSPKIVGRERELRLIDTALLAAKETGRGQVLVLRGEPGLGKSRLVEETIVRAAALSYTTRLAQVTSFGIGPDADTMRATLRALTGIESSPDPEAALNHHLAASGLANHLQVLARELAGQAVSAEDRQVLSTLGADAREHGRAQVMASLAHQIARDHPSLFVIEDMHWASREMTKAMAHLARNLADVPAILLMTVRPETDPFDSQWRNTIGTTPLTIIDLSPLDQAEAGQLVRNLAEGSVEIKRIVERAGGSPLFLVQLAHYVFEAESDLPASIRSLIAARVDQISPASRGVLQCAAILGQRFSRPELAFMREGQQQKLDELFDRHLLGSMGDQIEFVHALVRDAVYDMVPKSRRKRLHGRAAEWFADRSTALWAHHLGLAGDARAAHAYWQVAHEARLKLRLIEAKDHNSRGMSIAESEKDRLDLLLQRGEILLDLGEGREAESVWRDAASLARQGREFMRAEIGIAQALRLLGRSSEAQEALRRAEAVTIGEHDEDLLSLLHSIRGNLLFPTGRYDDCVREHATALHHAKRAGSAEAEVRALGGMGDADYLRGRIASAEQSFGACVDLAEHHGFGRIALANRPMLALCRLLCGRLEEAATLAAATVQQAHEIGAKREEMIAQHCFCLAQLHLGNFASAITAAERARSLSIELGARHFEYEAILFRAFALMGQGDHQEGLIESRRAVSVAREAGMAFMGAVCLAAVAAFTADDAERAAAIEECLSLLKSGCIAHNYFLSYPLLIESAIRRRDWMEAIKWCEAFESYAVSEPFFFATLYSSAGKAIAQHGNGDSRAVTQAKQIAADAKARGYVSVARWIIDCTS